MNYLKQFRSNHPVRGRRSRGALLSRPLLTVFGALAFLQVHAQSDDPQTVLATEVLAPVYFRSVNFEIENEVRAREYFYHFKVTSDFGNFEVASVSVLQKRLYEIEVLAAVEPEMQKRGLNFDRSPGGRRGVDSDVTDILTNPVGTAGKLLDNLRYNFDETFGEGAEQPAPAANIGPTTTLALSVDPGPHKRSAASQLGVDVYSSNGHLQTMLDELARARSSGRLRDSVAPVNQIKVKQTEFGTGLFDTRIASKLKNNSAAEINAEVARILDSLGVDPATKIELLSHPAYTPRDALYLSEYLQLISRVDRIAAFADGALSAKTEADVAAFINIVRMLAYYHLTETKLKLLAGGGGFPVVVSHADQAVVPLPVDYLPWNDETKTIVEDLQNRRAKLNASAIVLLLVGTVTDETRSALKQYDILVKEKYSF